MVNFNITIINSSENLYITLIFLNDSLGFRCNIVGSIFTKCNSFDYLEKLNISIFLP